MIHRVRRWTEGHALLMLFGAGLSLGLEDMRPMVALAVLSFTIFLLTGFRSIVHLKPAGGYANWVTFIRLAGVCAIVLCAGQMESLNLALLALLIVVADGLDGYLARTFDHQSDFGAVFDMEVDALFAALFSIMIYLQFEIGAWILVAGLMRYGFVFLLTGLGWTKRDKVQVPEGKIIAVIFFLTLLTPYVLPLEWAWWLLLVGSLLIFYSFTKELVLLARGSH